MIANDCLVYLMANFLYDRRIMRPAASRSVAAS